MSRDYRFEPPSRRELEDMAHYELDCDYDCDNCEYDCDLEEDI